MRIEAIPVLLLASVLAFQTRAEDAEAARTLYLAEDCDGAAAVARPLAEAGDAAAQDVMGLVSRWACGEPGDWQAAQGWWEKAAAQGLAAAEYHLGMLRLEDFPGQPADAALARQWLEAAAAQDYPDAFTDLGWQFESGGFGAPDLTEAVRLYREGRRLGASQSVLNLAHLTRKGEGVPEDAKLALALYREAAALGNVEAANDLGSMYKGGIGAAEDRVTAYYLYERAYDRGYARAGVLLAWMRFEDEDAFWHAPPYALATCLWALDLANGDERSALQEDCDAMEGQLSPEEVAEARTIYGGL
jgi:TPR repeat protein